jgi:hypothetical protein
LPEVIDPVDGKKKYVRRDEFGRLQYTWERWERCVDINHGNCPYYEDEK